MKFSVVALTAFLASTASALTLGTPVNKHFGATTTVSWTNPPANPSTWTLYLSKSNQIWAFYGYLATNVDGSAGSVTVTIPTGLTPASDYALKAVYNDNIDRVIAESPAFALSA